MSVNSSSSPNASSNSMLCFSPANSQIFLSFAFSNILLLLPLTALVLHTAIQRWWRQRASSAMTTTSHADLFTYHMVAMEILGLMGCGFYSTGTITGSFPFMVAGFYLFSLLFPGQTLFHLLTCVERYLAVVHPVTYLGLRKETRIRSAIVGCVWLICFGWLGVLFACFPLFPTSVVFYASLLSVLVTFFCKLSVLRALAHPSPGEGGRDGRRVDQTKQRAFHTIVVIAGALLLRFVGLLVCMILYQYLWSEDVNACLVLGSGFWFCLPSSLVLPLLFLHRTGRLRCRRHNGESG